MKKISLVLTLACCLALSNIGYSQQDNLSCQSCLCSVDPAPVGVMISHVHAKKQWMFSYRYMNMAMRDMFVGTDKVSDDDVFQKYLMSSGKMIMQMHMLMGMYGLTNRITLMGMMHYNQNSMDMTMLPGTTHIHNGIESSESDTDRTMRSNGFGDTKIQALVGLLNSRNYHLVGAFGVSLPTGSIGVEGDANTMYSGQRFPYAMQLGSGTYDLLPAINFLVKKGKVTWSSQVSAVVRLGENKVGYAWGNEYSTNHWLSLKWASRFSSSARLEALTASFLKGRDYTLFAGYEPAANPFNYGGQRVNAFIGTNYYFTNGLINGTKLGIEYGIPLYQNLFGPQMGNRSFLLVSWSLCI